MGAAETIPLSSYPVHPGSLAAFPPAASLKSNNARSELTATEVIMDNTDRAIILEHDGGGNRSETVAALKIVLPRLLAEGFHLRTLRTGGAVARKTPGSAPREGRDPGR